MAFRHPDIAAALESAQAAAIVILDVYQEAFTVDYKAGREPVTQADREADHIITDFLVKCFPGDAFLTEENGFRPPANPPNPATNTGQGRVWFVDPIDGTREFIKKNGEFSIQIGLAVDGRLSAGLIFRPTTGEAFAAVRGSGCFMRPASGEVQPLRLLPRRAEDGITLALSRSHPSSLGLKVAQEIGHRLSPVNTFICGGVGLKLLGIIAGKAHFYLNDSNATKSWDSAAPEIIFTEAGGTITDLRGQALSYDPHQPHHHHGLLATGEAGLHQEILATLARHARPPARP